MSTSEKTTGTTLRQRLTIIQHSLKAPKDHRSPMGYQYRSCEDILESLKPLLYEQGVTLVLSDAIEMIGTRFYVKATATLSLGTESISATAYAREEENRKGTDEAKITGAASSYARKYALNGLFCIDDTKDSDATNDGEKKSEPVRRSQQASQSTPPVKVMNAAKPEKVRPTATMVMETMTRCEKLRNLQTVYDAAFKYEWQPDDLASINECFLNVYGRLSNWPLHDQLHFFTADNVKMAGIAKDPKTGKLTVVELGPAPETPVAVPAPEAAAEAAMAESERAGMAA